MRKTLESLTDKDSIVFLDLNERMIVVKPTVVYRDNSILVHYKLESGKGTAQILFPEDILAIQNCEHGLAEIPGLDGKYDILQPDKFNEYLEKK